MPRTKQRYDYCGQARGKLQDIHSGYDHLNHVIIPTTAQRAHANGPTGVGNGGR